MKKYTNYICILCLLFLYIQGNSQTRDNKWAVGAGVGVVYYPKAPQRTNHLGTNILAQRYLTGAIDFQTNLLLSKVYFPTAAASDNLGDKQLLIDLNYTFKLKFNNGLFIKENARVAPFFQLGIGGSYVEGHPDVYMPIGGGVQFKVTDNISIRAESIKKFSLNKDQQNVAHAIAFIYNIDMSRGEKDEILKDVPEELRELFDSNLTLELQDTDKDGIFDNDDLCPNEAGYVTFDGCASEQQKVDMIAALEREKEALQQEAELIAFLTPEEGEEVSEFGLPELEWKSGCIQLLDPSQASLPDLIFSKGSDKLDTDDLNKLDQVAQMLRECENVNLMVKGFGDSNDGNQEDLLISIMRAYKAKYYLVYHHELPQNRIKSNGDMMYTTRSEMEEEHIPEQVHAGKVTFDLIF